MFDRKSKIKDSILDELMAEMDDHDGERLKPKAVSITEIKPLHEMHGEKNLQVTKGEADEDEGDNDQNDEEMSDDDIRELIKAYANKG